jgi:SpoIID/LytB domain
MLRWLLKLIFLAFLAFGFYHIAFKEAPDLRLPTAGAEILAANMPDRGPTQPEIRVLVAEALSEAVLTINGRVRMEVRTMQDQKRIGDFSQSVAVDVTATGNGIRIGAEVYMRVKLKNLDSQPLRLAWKDEKNETITIAIPHEIEIYGTHVADKAKRTMKPMVRVLARLPIEEYLYGVVRGEVPANWPLEALRAQAVASRTYAYFEVKSRGNEEYDVKATTSSQVWRPTLAVEQKVQQAVDSTAGIVVTEKNALIKTFFSSECGGFTADARWVFTKAPILALSGVRCPRCSDRANKPSTWSITYTRQEIMQRLRRAGVVRQQGEIRVLQGLDAAGNPMGDNLGRVVTVEIVLAGASGTSLRIPANQFRTAMGTGKDNIASTYMRISGRDEPNITFTGQGWGHGVGLCQYGAAYAADKMRYNYLDILALYYPGSKPVRLWGRVGQ